MTEEKARALIRAHFDASGIGAPGGGPDDDIALASEIYAEDAVVEWPQGGPTSASRGRRRRGGPGGSSGSTRARRRRRSRRAGGYAVAATGPATA